MYEKFGEFNSYDEINTIAENLKREKNSKDLYELAAENGIPEIDVILYWGNITDTFIDMHFAGINKIEMEKNDYLQEKHSINNINVEELLYKYC